MYFGARTECYARHVLCTSVHAQDGDMKEKSAGAVAKPKKKLKHVTFFEGLQQTF